MFLADRHGDECINTDIYIYIYIYIYLYIYILFMMYINESLRMIPVA